MKLQIANGKFIWSHVKHYLEPQKLNYIHPFYFKSGKKFFYCQRESMKKESNGDKMREVVFKKL